MADGVDVPGTYGVATDQDPATQKHYQKIKVAFGGSDVFILVDDTNRFPVSNKPTFTPKGYQQLPVTATAGGLTVPSGAVFALIRAAGSVRWRDDGVNPTTSVGMLMQAGDQILYDGNLAAIKFIAGVATTLDISYYA